MENRNTKRAYRAALIAAVVFFMGISSLTAQDKGFGAGVIIGEPTGIGAKLWLTKDRALDFAAAWSFVRGGKDGKTDSEGAVYFHADYLHHLYGTIDVEQGRLVPYVGIGVKTVVSEDLYLGLRIPLGLTYMFDKAPVDIFIELAPSVLLFPETSFDAGAGIGVRYWFGL
jgi:hypothetical protein